MNHVAAIFDVDGTLVTFEFDVSGTRKALLAELARRGFDTTGLGALTPTQQILDAAKTQVESGVVAADFDEMRGMLYSILDGFEANDAKSTSIFPTTLDTLRYLSSKGVRLAVLTNSGRKAADVVLERCGIRQYFEFVLTRDDVPTMKPRPEGLLKAVELFAMRPESVFYVGDSLFDVQAAREAGIKVVSVATGNYTQEKLKSGGADYVIADISQLPRVLGV